VHEGSAATASAWEVGARAYAAGEHIVFGAGASSTGADGDKLLAHELAHVVQQRSASPPAHDSVSKPGDPQEHEADRNAERVVAGGKTASTSLGTAGTTATLMRSPAPAGKCGPGIWPPSRKTFWFPGNLEHYAIQTWFLDHVDPTAKFEYRIPEAGKKSGGTGRADIAVDNELLRELYEIKPASQAGQGANEVDDYVYFAKKNCGPGWRAGLRFPPDVPILWISTGWQLRASLVTYGTIVYYWVRKSPKKATAPAPATAKAPAASSANPPGMGIKSLPVPTPGVPPVSSGIPPYAPSPPILTPPDPVKTAAIVSAFVVFALAPEVAVLALEALGHTAKAAAALLLGASGGRL
jgi:hypothetical protein